MFKELRRAQHHTQIFMCLLNQRSRVLPDEPKGPWLDNTRNFPTFYENLMFITAFTSACHLSQSLASAIHSLPPYPTSWTHK